MARNLSTAAGDHLTDQHLWTATDTPFHVPRSAVAPLVWNVPSNVCNGHHLWRWASQYHELWAKLWLDPESDVTSVYWYSDLSSLQYLPPLRVLLGGGGRILNQLMRKYTPVVSTAPWHGCSVHAALPGGQHFFTIFALLGSLSCSHDGQPKTQVTEVTWVLQHLGSIVVEGKQPF